MSVLVTANFVRTLINHQSVYTDIDGQTTTTIAYHVRRLDDAVVEYDGADYKRLQSEGIIPALGQTYVSWAGVSSAQLTFAKCRNIEFDASKTGTCIVTVGFTTPIAIKPNTLQGTPYALLPAHCEFATNIRTMETWRRGWTTPPPAASDVSTDIGGFELTSTQGGIPIEVPQVRLRLRFIRDAEVASMLSQATTVTTYIGKINSATFFGYPAGSVICEGMNMVHMQQETYEVVIDFLYDPYNHHEQVPTLNPDNTIKENAAGEAAEVKWKRITRTSTDFNAIFGGDATLKAFVEKGYW